MSKEELFGQKGIASHEVRLFPTMHIRGEAEAEMRATAALLAVIKAVSEFADKVTRDAGGFKTNTSNVNCYTEVQFIPVFKNENLKSSRPDGIIHLKRGKRSWTAFVEVKVGKSQIEEEQINKYLEWGKQVGIDAIISISNQSSKPNGDPPYLYNKRIRSIKVKHLSWERLLSYADMLLSEKGGIGDDDQRWILHEWQHYVADEASGIINQPDLGPEWKNLIKSTALGNLHNQQNSIANLLEHWVAALKVASLKLGASIGKDTQVKVPTKYKNDYSKWIDTMKKDVIEKKELTGTIKIPRASSIDVKLNISSKRMTISSIIDAPEDGRQQTRINYLIRQLRNINEVPDDLKIIVDWKKPSFVTCTEYKNLKKDINILLQDENKERIDKNLMPRFFIIENTFKFSSGRAGSTKKEVKNMIKAILEFYETIVQNIKPSEKKPIKMKHKHEEELPEGDQE